MWTKDLPTTPGWYWVRTLSRPQPSTIYVFEGSPNLPGLHVQEHGYSFATVEDFSIIVSEDDPIEWCPVAPPDFVQGVIGIVQTWLDKQGHDKCWYYPELLDQLAQKLGLSAPETSVLPPKEEFTKGCQDFRDRLYQICEEPK